MLVRAVVSWLHINFLETERGNWRIPRSQRGEPAMRSDLDIKRDVEDELISDPDVVATDVGVAVKDGVVTLTGFVRSFRQRRTSASRRTTAP